MVTKAIVKAIRSSDNEVDLYIPIYDGYKPTPNSSTLTTNYNANICTLPGVTPNYQVGDVVYICIEDNNLQEPVIMGLLYPTKNVKTVSDGKFSSLCVTVNTKLSADTTIGEVTAENIKCLSNVNKNIQTQFDQNLSEKVSLLEYLTDKLSKCLTN